MRDSNDGTAGRFTKLSQPSPHQIKSFRIAMPRSETGKQPLKELSLSENGNQMMDGGEGGIRT
ncbi:MAG: hypothetical protein JXQ85_07475, partial [Cognatishimia sp.]